MKANLRIGLVAVALVGLPIVSADEVDGHSHSLKDHLYEAARVAEVSFEEAYAAAKEAGVGEPFLVEAQTIHFLSTGNMPELFGHLEKLEAVSSDLEYGTDKPFHSERQLIGLVASIRAIRAYEADDVAEFEKQAASSYINAPQYNQAFGLLQRMTELRRREVQELAMANLRIPMDLTIASADGEEKTLTEWLGGNQALLIDFWASWCGPCIQLMPELRTKAETLPSQGVVVAAMNTDADDPVGKAKKVRDQHKMDLMPWLLEPGDRPLSRLLMIDSIPRMILVSPEGEVLYNGHPMDPSLKSALAGLDVKI
ncbi:MAG: TlpA disulfide reductase family protein [Verrucomicrobiota bacterium]|nr:TlpA disulfide reductase family protein [Verrucomicrobiota bacterium]